MENKSLYEITNNALEYTFIKDEFTEEEKAMIEQEIAKQLQQKGTGIVAVVRNNESLSDAINEEIKRLRKYKKTVDNGIDKLKKMTKGQMERLNIKKLDTALGVISIRNNPISVDVINEEEVSEAFKVEKTVVMVDKMAIRKHFNDTGEIPEGVRINYDKTSLDIK